MKFSVSAPDDLLALLRAEPIKPRRSRYGKLSNDLEFDRKWKTIVALYLQPPAHGAVICVEEKTAIQALERDQPLLPLGSGRIERRSFEYVRHEPSLCWRPWRCTAVRCAGVRSSDKAPLRLVTF